jgi:hypothetical protein
MGGSLRSSVDGGDGRGSSNSAADGVGELLRRETTKHPIAGRLLLTTVALLGIGVVLALIEPGNPDNTAMLNVFSSLGITLALTVIVASAVGGVAHALQRAVQVAKVRV